MQKLGGSRRGVALPRVTWRGEGGNGPGGVNIGADLPINLGNYYSANLTPAGPLKDWTDGEIFRALRDNVDKDGKRLTFMAGTNVRYISDEDMLAVIAFLRSQEPVASDVPMPLDQPPRNAGAQRAFQIAEVGPQPAHVLPVGRTPPQPAARRTGSGVTFGSQRRRRPCSSGMR